MKSKAPLPVDSNAIREEQNSFLLNMTTAGLSKPTIGPFPIRVVEIAKRQKIRPPLNFCEYLHYWASVGRLDSSWAQIATAIQESLGKTARQQIAAGYTPLSKLPKAPIFLCHASEDKALVRHYAAMMYQVGYTTWLDESELIAGQRWEAEIRRAIGLCFAVVVFISGHSHKEGYLQSEIGHALDEAEKHQDKIFLVPAKLEECEPPARLSHLHWVNLFADGGFAGLCGALRMRQAQEAPRPS
jgi:hypothetical protein